MRPLLADGADSRRHEALVVGVLERGRVPPHGSLVGFPLGASTAAGVTDVAAEIWILMLGAPIGLVVLAGPRTDLRHVRLLSVVACHYPIVVDELERQRELRPERDRLLGVPNCPRCLDRMKPAEVEGQLAWRCPECGTTAQP